MWGPLEFQIIGYARTAEYHDLTARLRKLRMAEDGQRARRLCPIHIEVVRRFVVAVLLKWRRALPHGSGAAPQH